MKNNKTSNVMNNLGRKRWCSMPIRELFKIIAQILIPLMIAIFTIVIALQQHNMGKENRKKDLEIATQLRQQQFQLDEHRRAQELALDEGRRIQDLSIADNNHRDSVFNVYIRDLSNLLLINRFNLSRPLLDSIIRPMTLTVLRQLDSSRKILLLKFLYESKMLRSDFEETRVDLSDADLSGIQFGSIRMHNLSLSGASLINTTFIRTDLTRADFDRADLSDALFINATLAEVCFYRTKLKRVQFFQSTFFRTDLAHADLTQSTITLAQLQSSSSYNDAILPNGEQTVGQSMISLEDKCSLNNWNIEPNNTINLTDQCHFIGLKDNITMKYDLPIYVHRRLIEREQALLELSLKASMKSMQKLRVDFLFFAQENGNQLIDRRHGITVVQLFGTTGSSLLQYVVASTYPRHALFLTIEIFLNNGDLFTDFDFYVQHFDFMKS